MEGIPNSYMNLLDEGQRKMAITGPGKMFLDEFVWRHGNHAVVPGTTGSGKTNLGYWITNWLKISETQIWMDSGKSDEILPLLCLGEPVHIICPKYTDVIIEERINGRWERLTDHPKVTYVPDAGDTWWAINKKAINILCFRNAFWTTQARIEWVADLFQTLAEWTRLRRMPKIFPFTLHADETQWLLPGVRITRDEDRVRGSEIITENALEIRSSGGRLIMYVQDFMNLPPAVRQNLVCAFLKRGAEIKSEQSKKLARHCFPPVWEKSPANYRREECKFVTEDGRSSPTNRPWVLALMPKSEEDRAWLKRCRVRYVGFNDQRPAEAETEEECFPELGRFSVLAIKPEVQAMAESRWNMPAGGIEDD